MGDMATDTLRAAIRGLLNDHRRGVDELRHCADYPVLDFEDLDAVQEINSALPVLDALERVVRAVAGDSPIVGDDTGWTVCHFCATEQGLTERHAEDCVWLLARKLIGESDG